MLCLMLFIIQLSKGLRIDSIKTLHAATPLLAVTGLAWDALLTIAK
jgi:hypothetical protein